MVMRLVSSEFINQTVIPVRYTGEGENVSPPLRFEDIPIDTQSLALIVDDPDAPGGTFDHWIAWNLSRDELVLPENAQGLHEGKNSFGDIGYGGPMPPPGPSHRYFFKLFALNTELDLPDGSTKKQLEEAMEGHILARTQLIGLYKRA